MFNVLRVFSLAALLALAPIAASAQHRGGGFHGGFRGGFHGGFQRGFGFHRPFFAPRPFFHRPFFAPRPFFNPFFHRPFFGFGFGFGVPYAYPYPYPYAYSPGPNVTVIYPPASYAAPEEEAPAASEPAAHLYYSPPATSGAGVSEAKYLIAFKNGSVQDAVAYWVDDGTLHYIDTRGRQMTAPLAQVDVESTRQLSGVSLGGNAPVARQG